MLDQEDWTPEDTYSLEDCGQKMLTQEDWTPEDAYLGRLDRKRCLPRNTGPQKMLTQEDWTPEYEVGEGYHCKHFHPEKRQNED